MLHWADRWVGVWMAWVIACATAAASLSAAPGAVAAAGPGAGEAEFELVLWKAVFHGETPGVSRANLVLHLDRRGGRWERVWGWALSYNNGIHQGLVREGEATADSIRLKLDMLVEGDAFVRDVAHGKYAVELAKNAQGQWEGRFQGRFKGQAVEGQATARMMPARRAAPAEFTPVSPGEHPRLLFRRGDLPGLREKLKTPLGQRYLEIVRQNGPATKKTPGDPINLGVLYQLTGDRQYAEQALEIVRKYHADPDEYVSDRGRGSGGWGHTYVAAALTYDLCQEAWPEDFRKSFEQRMVRETWGLNRFLTVTSHPNWHPCSNYYGPGFGASGIASLLFYGDVGAEPQRPEDMASLGRTIEPASDYVPAAGVPVVELSDGVLARWLVGGPVSRRVSGDMLGSSGGYAKARPAPGMSSRFMSFVEGKPQGGSITFGDVPAEALSAEGVDLAKLAGGNGPASAVFYCVVRVDKDASVGAMPGADARMWMSGVELNTKETYRLKPGLYPLLAVYASEKAEGTLAPRLVSVEGAAFAARRGPFEMAMRLWEQDAAEWREQGQRDFEKQRNVNYGVRRNYLHYRLGIGDGGFQAETGPAYSNIASWYPLNFAAMWRRMTGRDVSADPDVTLLAVRRLMQVAFLGGGETTVQPINSAAGIDPSFIAAAMPITPDEYKPALLWAWNHVAGVTGPADAGKVLTDGGLKLALAFLNYPTDLTPRSPAEVMPRVWEAPGFGYYCFRNGWTGGDDFITQVFAKARMIRGWNHPNAGTFRIRGLGHEWVSGSSNRVGFRIHEPVVLLPVNEINEGASGRVTHLATTADGSGSVTIDLEDVYATRLSKAVRAQAEDDPETSAPPRDGPMYDGNLLRLAENFGNSGIRGRRAFAIDYSGKSGAPALMVIVDQIDGGGDRTWLWPLPPDTLAKTRVEGQAFVIDHGDASLKATFITPDGPELKAMNEYVEVGVKGDRHRSYEGTLQRVRAIGTGHFMVVVTIQKGAAPVVKVDGTGLDSTVTVGGRVIRYDGKRVILSE